MQKNRARSDAGLGFLPSVIVGSSVLSELFVNCYPNFSPVARTGKNTGEQKRRFRLRPNPGTLFGGTDGGKAGGAAKPRVVPQAGGAKLHRSILHPAEQVFIHLFFQRYQQRVAFGAYAAA